MRIFGAASMILLPLSLAACSPEAGDEAGGLSPGEASELNQTAAELDARPQAPQDEDPNAVATDPAATSPADVDRDRAVP